MLKLVKQEEVDNEMVIEQNVLNKYRYIPEYIPEDMLKYIKLTSIKYDMDFDKLCQIFIESEQMLRIHGLRKSYEDKYGIDEYEYYEMIKSDFDINIIRENYKIHGYIIK